MQVLPEVERLVREVRARGEAAWGSSASRPVIAARLFGARRREASPSATTRTPPRRSRPGALATSSCKVDEIAVDERLEIVSTPAYMLGPWIAPVAAGIDKLVSAVLEMA